MVNPAGRWQNPNGQLCIDGAGRIHWSLDRSDYVINLELARITKGNGIFFRDSGGIQFIPSNMIQDMEPAPSPSANG
ncbi:MAG: hypothetical protein K6356_02655 [Chloroflexus sp.]